MIFILSAVIILLDQLSKSAAIKYLKGSASYNIIPNFFRLSYVENFGAAFGILQNKKYFFYYYNLYSNIFSFLFSNKKLL